MTTDFDCIRLGVAKPEKIISWSYGEVKKPETINYRTFRPERDGLFCAKIFGPVNDWECLCGKYKRMKYKGVVCDKCGVEVTHSRVRRERMGHIVLSSPCSHVWFFKGLPSRIGQLLDMTLKSLERVLYFESYVVIEPGQTGLKEKDLLDEEKFREIRKSYTGDDFRAGMGAEAIRELLSRIDVEQLANDLREKMQVEVSHMKRAKYAKRLKVVDSFRKSGNRPEWMILTVVPVIPPELRPLVPLDGGRFATSDLNDLYRRVLNRNNRLKKLLELRAPEVIIRNEKRMLQEAVDALFDNGRRGRVIRGSNNRPLKSLSDNLKGKQGRFRQNLLGKRVDYSGRSVIVVGPELKLHQCGLPKKMALELFKPFIYQRLEIMGCAPTVKSAKEMVEQEHPVVWDILEEVIKEHPVLLNRAPTLHRLGIQAFEPVLIEGKAIQIHPLVCAAFNADFDGDQMAVHIPLSPEAQLEAAILMLSSRNILSPASGRPIAVPSQDMVLGIYYLTSVKPHARGAGRIFGAVEEVVYALENRHVELNTPIYFRYSGQLIDLARYYNDQDIMEAGIREVESEYLDTTVGRVIFNDRLPAEVPFINGVLKKEGLKNLCHYSILNHSQDTTIRLLDDLKNTGFLYATRAGISIGFEDLVVPEKKQKLVDRAKKEVIAVENMYLEGRISNGERYNKVVDIWSNVTDRVADEMFTSMEKKERETGAFNPIAVMAASGARGSKQQIRQLAGMRGLMAKPSGEIIETPITSNFREGLTVLQYFISTHGARKGLADTALKTADSGYLTRRLVDVAQDVIISMEDCGTLDGVEIKSIVEGGETIESLRDRIVGRVALEDIQDPITGENIVSRNEEITEYLAGQLQSAGIETVNIRSVLTCKASRGVCIKCYGRNLGTGKLVELGEATGVIAAQSIGEPGTQLTMRTFHIGGTASKVEAQSTIVTKNPGKVSFRGIQYIVNTQGTLTVMNRSGNIIIEDEKGRDKERYPVVYGARILVKDGDIIEPGTKIVEWDPFSTVLLTEASGTVRFKDILPDETVKEEKDEVSLKSTMVIIDSSDEKLQPQIEILDDEGKVLHAYLLPSKSHLAANDGDRVSAGDILAKIPKESTKTKDITGGLPRVVELFEARKPKNPAVITQVDGKVHFGGIVRGQRKIIIRTPHGDEREYFVPRGAHITVQEGEEIKAGTALVNGPINPHDILNVLGEKELQKYLLNEIQEVYRLQGVQINDKHIEVIIRQMMRWIRVENVGDTDFYYEQQVDKFRFQEENERMVREGRQPAIGRPLLLGITKSSLSTDSFISAASFQETTRVLTEASIAGRVDRLMGLKENVIMGRLIPAGTGFKRYRQFRILTEEHYEEVKEDEPDMIDLEEMGMDLVADMDADDDFEGDEGLDGLDAAFEDDEA
ncbi:MAG: DNA-directed RNA polymerase subunit beta' [Acidobacteria bacterium]|nr:DNA-directed RNA polymerase subunit beta' [Acidobacteriota bacterium]